MRLKPTILLGRSDERSVPALIPQSSTFWIVALFSVLWLLSFRYCSLAFTRDPGSYFFDEQRGYQRQYSLKRERQAYSFLEVANHSTSSPPANSSPSSPAICVGVATVAREGTEQYVRGTIGSLLEGLSDEERSQIYLMPFIAHTDPTAHPVHYEPWISVLPDKVLEYDDDVDMVRLRMFEDEHHPRNKSMYDYGFLLEKCLDTGAKWIAMIEDDTLARVGWYAEAIRALERVEKEANGVDWLYLRIFYTEGLLGWNSEEWPRYLAWSLSLFLVLLSTLIATRWRWPIRFQRILSNPNVTVICCVFLPAFIALYFMAGRVSMQPPSPGVRRMPKFGCCSQGLIFPREIVPRTIERTKQAMFEDYYIDMLLERWADSENLARFALFPSLLQHVGGHSSKGWGFDKHAGTTWNFQFETYQL